MTLPDAATNTVNRTDWESRTEDERRKFLNDRFVSLRLRNRDVADVAISSINEVLIRRFVEGLPNLIGPFPGIAEVVTPEGTIPAKGVVGTHYALYREFDSIELPAGIDVANARDVRAVCGVWFGE